MGVLFTDGYKDLKPNIIEAFKWYELSADKGYAKAKYNLAILLSSDSGIKNDYAQAKKLFEDAAALGDVPSLNELGNFYKDGIGVQENYAQASEYYLKAANAGYSAAENNKQT